jgi:hypothetical protein
MTILKIGNDLTIGIEIGYYPKEKLFRIGINGFAFLKYEGVNWIIINHWAGEGELEG